MTDSLHGPARARASSPTAIPSSRSCRARRSPGATGTAPGATIPDWTRHAERRDHRARARHLVGLAGRRHRRRLRPGRGARHRHRRAGAGARHRGARPRSGSATRRRSGSAARRSGCSSTARPSPSAASGARRSSCSGSASSSSRTPSTPTPAGPMTGRRRRSASIDMGDLPAIDEAAARAFLDEALALVPPELRPRSLGDDRRSGAADDVRPARALRHARGGPRGARLDPERRSRLRQLGPHRPRAEGRAGRGRPRSLRRLVGPVRQGRARLHREDLGRAPARADRRRHDLPPRDRARLEAGRGAGARRRRAARRGASGGRAAGEHRSAPAPTEPSRTRTTRSRPRAHAGAAGALARPARRRARR